MATFVVAQSGLSTDEAFNLLSVAGDLQICQVVEPQKSCRYMLPKSIAKQLGIALPAIP
jgi:amidase